MIPDKMKVLSQLHRLHHHHHHHHQDREDRLACKKDLALGRKAAHWSKKSQRVARKMSKLEEKLRKYKDNCNALVVDLENEDEALSSSSINNDDAPLERADRRHHRHHHHHHRRGGRGHPRNDGAASCSADSGDSSDSSSSDSDSDDSKSAGSSRSVSPRQRRRRHQHPHHHDHHHQRRQRRGKPSVTADRDAHQDDDGIYGCVYRILSRSEPSLHDKSCSVANAAAAVGESQSAVVVDLEAHSYCTARDDDSERGSAAVAPAQVSQDCEMMNEDDEKIEDVDDVVLEDGWKKIVLEGLSAEDKAALTSKYSVAKRAHILQAPRLNPELRLVAGPRALERDLLLASQQSQLGSGLKALARGLGCLRGCAELEKNSSVAEALGQLEDASRLLLDAHRDASRARRLEMRADLRHEARDALDHHQDDDDVDRATTINDEDGWLFGGEAAARLKDLRCFKKCQRREERREARSEKGQKRKLAQGRAADQSKRTTSCRDSSSKKQLDNLAELSIKNS